MATFITNTSAALLNMVAVNEHSKHMVSYLRQIIVTNSNWLFFCFEMSGFCSLKDFWCTDFQAVLFLLMLNSSIWFFRLYVDVGDLADGVDIS